MKNTILFLLGMFFPFFVFSQNPPKNSIEEIDVGTGFVCTGDSIIKFNIKINKEDGREGPIYISSSQNGITNKYKGMVSDRGTSYELNIFEKGFPFTDMYDESTLDKTKENEIEIEVKVILEKQGSSGVTLTKTAIIKLYPPLKIEPDKDSIIYCGDTLALLELGFKVTTLPNQELSWVVHKDGTPITEPYGTGTGTTDPTGIFNDVYKKPNATKQDNGEYSIIIRNTTTNCIADTVKIKVEIDKAIPLSARIKEGNNKNLFRDKVNSSFLVCEKSTTPPTKIGIDKDVHDNVRAVYWIKKVNTLLKDIDIRDETKIKIADGYIGSYKYGYSDGQGGWETSEIKKDISTTFMVGKLDILGDDVAKDTSMWGDKNAGILEIKVHQNGGTDSTDGWYYVIADMGASCVSVDSFLVRYPTFVDTMTVYLDNKRDGVLCGGRQGSKRLEVRGIPPKDKYGYDVRYTYQWYYLSSDIVSGEQLKIQTKFITVPSRDIEACNVGQDIRYTPLYVHIKQEECDCPWNPDTIKIKEFIVRKSSEDDRIDSIIIEGATFLSRLGQDRRADSLFLPMGQYPLPKMSFNVMENVGGSYQLIKRLDGNNIDNIVSTECPERSGKYTRDTTFSWSKCENDLYIGLLDEGKESKNPIEATSKDIKLFSNNGTEIKQITKENGLSPGKEYLIYRIDKADQYYYSSNTDKGCTPISEKLMIKTKEESVVSWYEANCIGDTVKLYLKGGLEYTLQNPFETKIAKGTGDTVVFIINPENVKGNNIIFRIDVKLDAGCNVTKDITVTMDELGLLIQKKEQTGTYGQTFSIEAKGAENYYWFEKEDEDFSDTLSKERIFNISPSRTTEYILVGKTIKGCISYDECKIVILNDPLDEDFESEFEKEGTGASNQVITSNGDGINEGFIVPDKYMRPYYELVIMNRWGDVIYRKNNYQNDWKGTGMGGKKVSDGTYYYQLNRNGSQTPDKRGIITVLGSGR